MSSARRKVGWRFAAVLAVLLLSAAVPVVAQQLTGNSTGTSPTNRADASPASPSRSPESGRRADADDRRAGRVSVRQPRPRRATRSCTSSRGSRRSPSPTCRWPSDRTPTRPRRCSGSPRSRRPSRCRASLPLLDTRKVETGAVVDAGAAALHPDGSRPVGHPADGPGRADGPVERRRQRERPADQLRREGRGRRPERLEHRRRDHHGHGRARAPRRRTTTSTRSKRSMRPRAAAT